MECSKNISKKIIEPRTPIPSIDFTNDALKKSISSSPLKSGGANFTTHTLVKQSSTKLVYKPSIGMALFAFAFFGVGLTIMFFSITLFIKDLTGESQIQWFMFFFGLIFASAGGFMFYYFYMPRVFDKQHNLYYKAHKFNPHYKKIEKPKNYVALTTICALQIIGERIRSDNGSYNSFELNLILQDGSRKNVVDHGNLKTIIDDADIISEFLNIPIWHAGSVND